MKAFFEKLSRMNPVMFFTMAALMVIGVLFIYSSCSVRDNPEVRLQYLLHAEAGVMGLALYVICACTDYRKWLRGSLIVYALVLPLLVLVLVAGTSKMGARRWIYGIQPSEPAKLAVILVLAWLYSRGMKRGVGMFFLSLAVVGLPALLILKQPDLGTAMVLVPTVLFMMFAANVAPKLLWTSLGIGLVGVAVVLGTVYAANRPGVTLERHDRLIARTCLRPHQVRRLEVFLYPDKDLYGSGYNRRQSEIAVGSGGATGKGYLKGEQYLLGYLPPSVASNDFIFAVLAEEAGFAGSLTVLLLFLGLLLSVLWVAIRCRDDGGRILCVGVAALIFSHMFINIAMTIGAMPITGLPLPFISYGRTFTLTCMAALGLVQSVALQGRERETEF